MKHLLNGVAIIATLAIAAPIWAQTSAPMTPSSRAPAATAPAAPAASPAAPAPMATKARHKRVAHRGMRRGMARRASPDSMANQLNAQELQRVGGGGARNLMAPGTLGGGYGQPSPTQGIPGGDQPSASSHPPPSR
jgi:hypothetical protein